MDCAGWSAVLSAAGSALAQDEPNETEQTNTETRTEAPDNPVPAMFPHVESDRVWLSGQANFIFQTHPPFHAAYSGKNSLDPNYEKAISRVLTLYTGLRLNESTEFILDVEEAGGAALSTAWA